MAASMQGSTVDRFSHGSVSSLSSVVLQCVVLGFLCRAEAQERKKTVREMIRALKT